VKKRLVLLTLLSTGFFLIAAEIPIQRNSLGDINDKLDKITLETVRTWGAGDDDTDAAIFFKNPADVAIDSQNNLYFVDSGENCIKVFNAHGTFLRQIGERGQGPGTFFSPSAIGIDGKDHIWIFDRGNRRYQLLSTAGKSLAVFKTTIFVPSNVMFPAAGQMAYLDYEKALKGEGIIAAIDMNGNLLVFGNDGKVKAAKQLDCYCSGIYIHKNHLFLFDIAFNKEVYEYRYAFR